MKKITYFLTLLVTILLANSSFAQFSFPSVAGPTAVAQGIQLP